MDEIKYDKKNYDSPKTIGELRKMISPYADDEPLTIDIQPNPNYFDGYEINITPNTYTDQKGVILTIKGVMCWDVEI